MRKSSKSSRENLGRSSKGPPKNWRKKVKSNTAAPDSPEKLHVGMHERIHGEIHGEIHGKLRSKAEAARRQATEAFRQLAQSSQQNPAEKALSNEQEHNAYRSKSRENVSKALEQQDKLQDKLQGKCQNKTQTKRRKSITAGVFRLILRLHKFQLQGRKVFAQWASWSKNKAGNFVVQRHAKRRPGHVATHVTSSAKHRSKDRRHFQLYSRLRTKLHQASPRLQKYGHKLKQHLQRGLTTITSAVLNIGAFIFNGLHSLLLPSKLFRHYRRSYSHFRRHLLLRQCFYFVFSLSCLGAVLLTAWLFWASQHWQQRLQAKLQDLFVLLERQHGIQVRFRFQGLYLLHEIQLSDIQVRLEVPVVAPVAPSTAPSSAQDPYSPKVPTIPPLQKAFSRGSPFAQVNPIARTSVSHSPARLITWEKLQQAFPLREWPDLQSPFFGQLAAMQEPQSQQKQAAPPTSEQIPKHLYMQLYIRADQLRLQFSLSATLRHAWRLLRSELERQSTPQASAGLKARPQQTHSAASPQAGLTDTELLQTLLQDPQQLSEVDFWQLFQLLQNIEKLALGNVELKIYTADSLQTFSDSQAGPAEIPGSTQTVDKFPFEWPDFLQLLRAFPIEIQALQLDFDLWEQLLVADDIRFLMQDAEDIDSPKHLAADSLAPHPQQTATARLQVWQVRVVELWQRFLQLLPGAVSDSPSLVQTRRQQQTRIQVAPLSTESRHETTRKVASNYLFDLRGKFRSQIKAHNSRARDPRTEKPGAQKSKSSAVSSGDPVLLWGQFHARGGLTHNFSQAYLIVDMQELRSQYIRLRPVKFRAEYSPQELKLQALSKIRTLDWQLQYAFRQQALNLEFWLKNFRLDDYLELAPLDSDNAVLKQTLEPLLDAQLSGSIHVQIQLPRAIGSAVLSANQDLQAASNHHSSARQRAATTQTELQVQYRARLQAYLPQWLLSLNFDGRGDMGGLQVRQVSLEQDNWQLQFHGDLPYDNFLPDGLVEFSWRGSMQDSVPAGQETQSPQTPGYRGRFVLQRSGPRGDMLLIDTLSSQFSGLGLADNGQLPSVQVLTPEFPQANLDSATQSAASLQGAKLNDSQIPELSLGLPPWAQPQLRSFLLYSQGSYYISAQLRLPLSRAQMYQSEQELATGEGNSKVSLYRGSPLYPAAELQQYQAQYKVRQSIKLGSEFGLSAPASAGSLQTENFLNSEEAPAGEAATQQLFFNDLQDEQDGLGEAPFFLLPVFSLYGSANLQGRPPETTGATGTTGETAGGKMPLQLELNSLGWDAAAQRIENGKIPLIAILGRGVPSALEFLFPGLDHSYLQLSSKLQSNFDSFQLWLEELQLQGPDQTHKLLVQASANAQQINLDKLQLRWDTLKLDNQFSWNLLRQNGQGLLKLQDQPVKYRLQHISLPGSPPASQNPTEDASTNAPQGWLLQGDRELYAYFDSKHYQIDFRQLPLPQLPGLSVLGLRRPSTEVMKDINNMEDTGRLANFKYQVELGDVLLSLKLSGTYSDGQQSLERQNWQVDLTEFLLELPPGAYFPEGAELYLAGSWHPDQLKLQKLSLLEPQRLLQGQGNLQFIRPMTPVFPSYQLFQPPLQPSLPPAPENTGDSSPAAGNRLFSGAASPAAGEPAGSGHTSQDSQSILASAEEPPKDKKNKPKAKEPAAAPIPFARQPANQTAGPKINPYAQTQRDQPLALPLPQDLSQEGPQNQGQPSTETGGSPADDTGYWLGDFSLQGQLREASPRQGAAQIQGDENLQLQLRTEGQDFRIQVNGHLDATRFTRLLNLLRGGSAQSLSSGILQLALETRGQYHGPDFAGTTAELQRPPTSKAKTPNTQNFKIHFTEIQGQWQLAQASYAGRTLELGSHLLWRDEPDSWLFSEIRGHFGQLQLERSFFSFHIEGEDEQKLAGLLNYSLQIDPNKYYSSSLAINLERHQSPLNQLVLLPGTVDAQDTWEDFDPMERELMPWRGRLYSYPLRDYALAESEQAHSGGSFSAIASNLRNNVFSDSRAGKGQSSRKVYPGFDIFVEPRIILKPAESKATAEVSKTDSRQVAELQIFRHRREDLEMGIQSRYFWLNVGSTYPISFRAQGNSDGENIDAQVEQLTIEPRALNVLIPQDAIIEQPVLQFAQGRITGRLRVHGKVFDPSLDGSLRLQNVRLLLPYSPDTSPALNIEIVAKTMSSWPTLSGPVSRQPAIQFWLRRRLYTPSILQIARYYLNFGYGAHRVSPYFMMPTVSNTPPGLKAQPRWKAAARAAT